jgi:hypothetical protein
VERLTLATGAAAGAVLGLALPNALLAGAPPLAAAAGALLALAVQLGRQRLARALDRHLQGLGHIGAGIVADVAAGAVSAVTFLVAA